MEVKEEEEIEGEEDLTAEMTPKELKKRKAEETQVENEAIASADNDLKTAGGKKKARTKGRINLVKEEQDKSVAKASTKAAAAQGASSVVQHAFCSNQL